MKVRKTQESHETRLGPPLPQGDKDTKQLLVDGRLSKETVGKVARVRQGIHTGMDLLMMHLTHCHTCYSK